MNEKSFGQNIAEQTTIAFAISAASLLGFMVIGVGYGALMSVIDKKNTKTPTVSEK